MRLVWRVLGALSGCQGARGGIGGDGGCQPMGCLHPQSRVVFMALGRSCTCLLFVLAWRAAGKLFVLVVSMLGSSQ